MLSIRGQTGLTNIQPKIPSGITVFLIKEVSVSFNYWRICGSRSNPYILKEGQGEVGRNVSMIQWGFRHLLQLHIPELPFQPPSSHWFASCSQWPCNWFSYLFSSYIFSDPHLDSFWSSLGSAFSSQWANPTYPIAPDSPGPADPGHDLQNYWGIKH